eukprot:4794246-Lingulodinium_polyedra.AAC.1
MSSNEGSSWRFESATTPGHSALRAAAEGCCTPLSSHSPNSRRQSSSPPAALKPRDFWHCGRPLCSGFLQTNW